MVPVRLTKVLSLGSTVHPVMPTSAAAAEEAVVAGVVTAGAPVVTEPVFPAVPGDPAGAVGTAERGGFERHAARSRPRAIRERVRFTGGEPTHEPKSLLRCSLLGSSASGTCFRCFPETPWGPPSGWRRRVRRS